MMKIIYYISVVVLLASCGKPKTQLLEIPKEDPTAIAPKDSLQQSQIVYNAAVPEDAVRSGGNKGVKTVDPNNPPVNLALGNNGLEEKEINLSDYYSKVSYLKLKHPLPSDDGSYLGDSRTEVYWQHEGGESVSSFDTNSSVYMMDNHIVAGDNYFGYHVYDLSGKLIYTLAQQDPLPVYEKRNNKVTVQSNEMKNSILTFAMLNNIALISTKEDSLYNTHIYNIVKQKGVTNFKGGMGRAYLIDNESYLIYNPNTNIQHGSSYLYSVNAETAGVLNMFHSSNPEATLGKGGRTNPENHLFTYYNNVLTTKQAYNDTIYRVKNASTLNPAYVLDMGKMKLPIQDAFTGSKEGKLITDYWLENDGFMFIACTINHDIPNNRNSGAVKYKYYFYDKKGDKLYAKILKSYPEEYILKCDIEGSIPVLAKNAKTNKNKLYTYFTKNQIEVVLKNESFKDLSDSQQQKLQEIYDFMDEQEFLVQILE